MTPTKRRPAAPPGAGPTRLQPGLHYDPDVLAAPDGSAPCVLGTPRRLLRAVHWPALVNACAAQVQAALQQPVLVEASADWRRVSVLGTLVVERDARGMYRCYAWQPGGEPVLRELDSSQGFVDGVPAGNSWLETHTRALWQLMYQRWPKRGVITRYVNWVLQALVQRFWGPEVQARVRTQVAAALQTDATTRRRARRRHGAAEGSPLLALDYNSMFWQQRQWPRLRAEAGPWLALLRRAWPLLPTEGEPLQHLKAVLARRGIRPAFWRLLHREGTAWMGPLLHYYPVPDRRNGAAVIDLLLFTQAFGTQALVPVWMMRMVLNENGNPNRPRRSYARYWTEPAHAPLLARLAQWLHALQSAGDAAGLARLQENLHLMLLWDDEHPEYAGSQAMRQVTLDGYLRRARLWAQEQALQAQAEAAWPVRFDVSTVSGHGLQAVALTSAWALWQEGRMMRHCASAFTQRCRVQQYFMVSIRRADTQQRVATAGFKLGDEGPVLDQMTGFANARVSPAALAFALRLQRTLRRQNAMNLARAPFDDSERVGAVTMDVGGHTSSEAEAIYDQIGALVP